MSVMPASPMARQVITSSCVIASAVFTAASKRSAGSRGRSVLIILRTAQERFTAVGRALAMTSAALSRASFSGFSLTASTTAHAPVMPMSGAPRTRMVRMASTQSRQSPSTRFSKRYGRSV